MRRGRGETPALGIPFAGAIHPSVAEGIGVTYGEGNVVCERVALGACVRLGNNNFMSAGCGFEHHTSLGSTIASGAIITADVPRNTVVKVRSNMVFRPST